MKMLVLGASGMAGHVLACALKECGHSVTGFARNALPFCDTVCGDAIDPQTLKNIVQTGTYDAVINCIGVLNQAVDSRPDTGIYLNSVLPHQLAEFTRETRARVVHLSTDCVFSGTEGGNYVEKSFRSADTLYGRSKALGELEDAKNLTIRTSIVGPDMRPQGVGLFNWFMQQSGNVKGYTDAIWTGVTTIELASAVVSALEQNISGIYHLVNNEKINKCALLGLFNKIRKEPVEIMASDEVHIDKSLMNTRTDFVYQAPSYERMVADMEKWIYAHAALYPHYKLS